ncbi:hypothetical protein [Paenarthrobacter nitroguajacolicus]
MLSRTDDQASGYRFVADELLHGRRSGLEGITQRFGLDRQRARPWYAGPLVMLAAPPTSPMLSLTRRSARPAPPLPTCASTRRFVYGARDPKVAAALQAVENDSLVMLQPVVPTSIALAINPLLWGWWIHRLAHPDMSLDEASVRRPYEAIVGLAAPNHPFHTKEQNHA